MTAWVKHELFSDPKVDDATIADSAENSDVTLRGTVGSLREKRKAGNAAQRVFGVFSVENQLRVRLLTDVRRADVLQALMLESLVPNTVNASVRDGYVSLPGTVNWQYERDETEFVASNTVGALGVFNEIEIIQPAPNAAGVKRRPRSCWPRPALGRRL